MTFRSWVNKSEYIKENSAIGDLARDISIDTDFPSTIEKSMIKKYLPQDEKILSLFNKLYSDFIQDISRETDD